MNLPHSLMTFLMIVNLGISVSWFFRGNYAWGTIFFGASIIQLGNIWASR